VAELLQWGGHYCQGKEGRFEMFSSISLKLPLNVQERLEEDAKALRERDITLMLAQFRALRDDVHNGAVVS
jgi:hypothetical protein